MPGPLTLLMDNGSLEPAATLALRGLAARLSEHIGRRVEPVSLLHSSAVPADKLGGIPAEILEPALERRLAAGHHEFLVVPMFFGLSGALTDYLPARVAHLREKHPGLKFTQALPLYEAGDERLTRILSSHIPRVPAMHRRVVVVDHGSPVRGVVAVRDQLAKDLGRALGPGVTVAAASMERREGTEYDFCEPLLAGLLRQPGWNTGEVTIAMQFLLPGRHAGPGGDVATICRDAELANGGRLRTTLTPLFGEHPLLIDILADRWRKASAA